ncbi:hypothetical protein VP01_1038g2 [Puccinia sorghi]|uniref:Uncharacterized protein n=1 Tax=Puccinia sorghi TaxID=27349 RepID=A0A0L6VUF7_9BASI|nr:hypothetical protein VP01_1038g2 [Puccinia sorghi]
MQSGGMLDTPVNLIDREALAHLFSLRLRVSLVVSLSIQLERKMTQRQMPPQECPEAIFFLVSRGNQRKSNLGGINFILIAPGNCPKSGNQLEEREGSGSQANCMAYRFIIEKLYREAKQSEDDSSFPVSNTGNPMIRTNESPLMGSTCPYTSTRARPNGKNPVWQTLGVVLQALRVMPQSYSFSFHRVGFSCKSDFLLLKSLCTHPKPSLTEVKKKPMISFISINYSNWYACRCILQNTLKTGMAAISHLIFPRRDPMRGEGHDRFLGLNEAARGAHLSTGVDLMMAGLEALGASLANRISCSYQHGSDTSISRVEIRLLLFRQPIWLGNRCEPLIRRSSFSDQPLPCAQLRHSPDQPTETIQPTFFPSEGKIKEK